MINSHIDFAHHLWSQLLSPGEIAVDATCGNGHDTLFLAALGAEVIACDIQTTAIQATQSRLSCEIHQVCHSQLAPLLGSRRPKLVVFNLGYLPGAGNKWQTTQCETTLLAATSLGERLLPGGLLSITCYPGHPEGAKEEALLLDWAAALPRESWSASHHQWLRHAKAPSLLIIQKK